MRWNIIVFYARFTTFFERTNNNRKFQKYQENLILFFETDGILENVLFLFRVFFSFVISHLIIYNIIIIIFIFVFTLFFWLWFLFLLFKINNSLPFLLCNAYLDLIVFFCIILVGVCICNSVVFFVIFFRGFSKNFLAHFFLLFFAITT